MRRFLSLGALLALPLFLLATDVMAQGITTSSVRATVRDAEGKPLAGARVTALHQPSGTNYVGTTGGDGRVVIPGMRVGGPYLVTAAAIGFEKDARENVTLTLGVASDLSFTLRAQAVQLQELAVTAENEGVFSSQRTGAATTVSTQAIAQLPTVSGRLEDFTRLTPQVRGSSFAGQDNRLNNITVDGSYFNNSFGLGGQPGDRTGVAPISMDAIEQVQINIAPYDVRQGNFVGAGVNTVTKSGTNSYRGSLYYYLRNQDLVGKDAGANPFDPGTFSYSRIGASVGGPIIKNKLFFFASYEGDGNTFPSTTFRANTGSETVGGNITRVLKSDLDELSSFLKSKFNYDPGAYQDYDFETPSTRILGRVDYNLNDRNKFSLRYIHLDSETDVLASNSSSLGNGNRRTLTTALNFQNSNYSILENIRSVVGEWNAVVGSNMANNLVVGYSQSDESRGYKGEFFPFVDILKDGLTYTSFGFEPFTPNNELRYKSFQFQNNFTIYGQKHDITFGVTGERYRSENVFFPGSQSVYVYNSLADFYADANDYVANPNRTASPVTLNKFQVRYSNIPGLEKPLQPLEVTYVGAYLQDEFRPNDRLTMTLGLRADVPYFGETGFQNTEANGLTFKDELGNSVQYKTEKLPDANVIFSPRFGFNWDVKGDRSTQVRGGTGVFTGRPAYVWISNQIGNNGVLTGFDQLTNTKARPWNPNPDTYKPTTVTGAPAASYEVNYTEADYRFPELWRSNLAIDHKLPWGLTATAEFLYSRDLNGTYYINANLPQPNGTFVGADNRPRWVGTNRIYSKISGAYVLKNQDVGYSWDASVSLEKDFQNGLFLKAAYSYGEAKNTVDAGSIASGSWQNNYISGNPNLAPRSWSAFSPGMRAFGVGSYQRDFFGFGATTVSLYYEIRDIGNYSYYFASDMNGDGGTNDLLYVHRGKSEMNFQPIFNLDGSVRFSAEQQAAAWDAFIRQDPYLSTRRGQYAERNAAWLPTVKRADFAFSQDISKLIGRTQNALQFRVDILNVGNLLNKDWGIGKRPVATTPLVLAARPNAAGTAFTNQASADALGRMQYSLRVINGQLPRASFEPTSSLSDVYRIQFGFRYSFR